MMTTVASPTLSPTWLTMTPDRHANTVILRSLPGVGVMLAGRMLSEFGDDPTRFADAASRRDYAGTAPLTKASGKGRAVLMRRVRDTRLFDTCRDGRSARSTSPRALGRCISIDAGSVTATRRRCAGSGTKLVGQLDHCLRHHERYRQETAWTLTA